MEVSEEGDQLLITTETTPKLNNIEVDVSGLTPRLVDRFLARSYQKGYDKITLKFDSQDILVAIQDKVPELLGFEIMSQTKNTCIIESISPKLNVDFDNSLRKAFYIILDMAETCLRSYKSRDNKALDNLYLKDYDVNKFCYFCLRSINKGHHASFGVHILYYLIESLEDGGDEYKKLAKNLAKLSKKKSVLEALKKVKRLTELAYDFFYTPQKQTAVDSINLYNELKKELASLMKTSDINEASAYNSMDLLSRIMYHFPTMRLDTLKGLGG